VVGALALSACSGGDGSSSSAAASSSTSGVDGPATPADAAALTWDAPAAAAFNGTLPAAEPTTVCGADDRRFLGELLQGNPLEYKVPKRLAEVKPVPSQVVISGTAEEPSLGEGDFPFDHTMGSDFNMNVKLDAPFMGVGQEDGKPVDSVHVELAEGQFPHLPAAAQPATMDWTKMSAESREGFQDGFLPRAGDRVLVMGTWIVDCGHIGFQTELHPITFMAVARTEGGATALELRLGPGDDHIVGHREALPGGEDLPSVADGVVVAEHLGHSRQRRGEVHRPEDPHPRWRCERLDEDPDRRRTHEVLGRALPARAVVADAGAACLQFAARVACDDAVELGVPERSDDGTVCVEQQRRASVRTLDHRGEHHGHVAPDAARETGKDVRGPVRRGHQSSSWMKRWTVPPQVRPTENASSSE